MKYGKGSNQISCKNWRWRTVNCYAYRIVHVHFDLCLITGVGNGTEKPANKFLKKKKTINFQQKCIPFVFIQRGKEGNEQITTWNVVMGTNVGIQSLR